MEQLIAYGTDIFVKLMVYNNRDNPGIQWVITDKEDGSGIVTTDNAINYTLREALGHFLEQKLIFNANTKK